MYIREILQLLGSYVKYLALILWLPFGISAYFQYGVLANKHPQPHATGAFFITLLLCYALSYALSWFCKSRESRQLCRKESLILVALIWLVTAIIGALPFYLSGTLERPIDALFESMSGLTTTGASVMTPKIYDVATGKEIPHIFLSEHSAYHTYIYYGTISPVKHPFKEGEWIEGLEAVSKGILFWRSLLQWLGGMGIVVLFVAVLPALGVGGRVLYSAEVPGLDKGGITPRIKETASKLWKLYLSLTLIQILLLYYTNPLVGVFDAITLSFSSISTGGFCVRSESVAAYQSTLTEVIILIFMVLGSLNFNIYFLLMRGKLSRALNAELKVYLLSLLVGSIVIHWYISGKTLYFLSGSYGVVDFWYTLCLSAFQYISAQSSTGFVTANYETWPYPTQIIMLIGMYLGGMSGSTGGGIKIIRHMMVFKILKHKVEKIYRPTTTNEIVIENRVISLDLCLSVLTYFAIVIGFAVLGTLLFTFDHIDPETAMAISSCMINNIGIAFRKAGPTESFAFLSNFSKALSIVWMLLGRLEFFAILVLFTPSFWTTR